MVPQAAKFEKWHHPRATAQRGFGRARRWRYGALLCLLGTFAGCELAGQRMLALQTDIYGEIAAAERAEHTAMPAELEVVQIRAQLQNSRNNLEDALHAPLSGPELALAKSMSSIASGAGS